MSTLVNFNFDSENLLSIVGASHDIAGAILLAKALVFVKPAVIMRQSLSGYGGVSIPLVKMFAEQKIDASFGIAFLIAGFIVQGLAGWGYKSAAPLILLSGLGAGILGLAAYGLLRQSMTRWQFVPRAQKF